MNGRVHHVGYVTKSIAACADEYAQSMSLMWDRRVIHDPLQLVSVAFLRSSDATATMVELVEPAGRLSPVNDFLTRGGGLHHICIGVPDLPAHIEACQKSGCALVRVPLPAVAFQGRKIAWIRTPGGQLIELLQVGVEPGDHA